MYAAQVACTSPAAASRPPYGDDHGEAVLVAQRQPGALDDRILACHAAFGSRVATHVLTRPGGGSLRYRSHQQVAVFEGTAPRLQSGDRITRCWDGVVFEVTSAYRCGGRLCCDLIEVDARPH